MTKIDQFMAKLRQREALLESGKKKIEFLQYVLQTTKKNAQEEFKAVKKEVLDILEDLITKACAQIEEDLEIIFQPPQPALTTSKPPASVPPKTQTPNPPVDVNTLMNFAMENRHLAGKVVIFQGRDGKEYQGKAVGLEAPFVLVKVDSEGETGPTIKIPRNQVREAS